MSNFPAITHVALTVRDLSVSAPWYEALLGAGPALDEDTDPNFHHTVYLLARLPSELRSTFATPDPTLADQTRTHVKCPC